MEKLICSACGAPLAPNTSEPFLTCEYCDTTVENKYYVEPEVPQPQAAVPEAEAEFIGEETPSGGSLFKTLLGVGTAIAASSAINRQRTVVKHRTPVARFVPAARPAPRVKPASARRLPEAPRTGGMGPRPARPGMGRPQGGRGGRGPGGRGGMGGPGGRHR